MKLLLCIFFMSLSAMSEQEMRMIPTESTPLLHAERQTCNPLTDAKKALRKLGYAWFKTGKFSFDNTDRACVYTILSEGSLGGVGCGSLCMYGSSLHPATLGTLLLCSSGVVTFSGGVFLASLTAVTGYVDYKEVQEQKLQRSKPSAMTMHQ